MARAIVNPGASIQRDAITAWSRSATVFVNYLASTASDRAVLSGKKTVQHPDVLEALDEMDFADFVAKTEAELAEHRRTLTNKRTDYRNRVAAQSNENPGAKSSGDDQDGDASTTDVLGTNNDAHANTSGGEGDTVAGGQENGGNTASPKSAQKGKSNGKALAPANGEEEGHKNKKVRLSEGVSSHGGGGDETEEEEDGGEFETSDGRMGEGDETEVENEEEDVEDEPEDEDEDMEDADGEDGVEGDVVEDLDGGGHGHGDATDGSEGEGEDSE
ncbi:MAG: hypothetical protein M1831_003023 [Alyxoria varia]|nr:MAG: hypothetical protein M1831_003023 [Alyxoria varia]